MKDITQYLTEDKFSDYENKAAEHILNVLQDYADLETPIEKNNYVIKLNSNIKKSDLTDIDKELRKVLASHEVSVGLNSLSVNVFKEPLLSISEVDGKYIVCLKGNVKTYYENNGFESINKIGRRGRASVDSAFRKTIRK